MAKIPVALQLYTVRDETAKDFVGTLQRVAEIGYAGVEFAGFGNLSAREVKKVITDLNLQPVAAHVGIENFDKDPGSLIADLLEVGIPYVVIPWMSAGKTLDEWEQIASRLNGIGALCKENDLQLCYHNHAHEFERVNGKYGLDWLYELTDPSLLKAELDVYWVRKGGALPPSYIKKYAGRVPLLHVKDMAGDPEGSFTEFGTGVLNWDGIFTAAQEAGVQWYIIEQDVCKRPCLESVEISLQNLKARGLA